MIGRRAAIGLSLLSALLVCAFAAQSASALVVTKSNNTTAFTCVKEGGVQDFSGVHCNPADTVAPGNGEYGHDLIALNTPTEIDMTNSAVTESTKKSEPAVLKGTISLAKVTIECTTVKNNVKTSLVENTEPIAGQHTLKGTIQTEFSTCNVKELVKCIVAEPIVAGATVHGVGGMEGPFGEKNAMGLEFVGHGLEETFATIKFKNKGAEACSLNGKEFPVKGRMIATNGPTTESAQENKESGATLVFTPKVKMQTLKFGPNAAEFSSVLTPTMAGGGSPISMTTAT